jgi:Ca2+-transporting ATPase
MVPADVRLTRSARLKVDESSLTGESVPVEKDARVAVEAQAPLYERADMAFAGTLVSSGTCQGLVVRTGGDTELGKISSLVKKAKGETPLEKRIGRLSLQISAVFISLILFYFFYEYLILRGDLLDTLLVAATLAVAAVPEGLPASVAILLGMGAKRMAGRKALVRKLSAVEALGSCAVICCDKTGTLTRNELRLMEVRSADGSGSFAAADFSGANAFSKLLMVGVLCNDASYAYGEGIGDSVDVAFLEHASKLGLDLQRTRSGYPRKTEVPFDSGSKMMITTHELGRDELVCLKGAPEVVLGKCDSVETSTGADIIDPLMRRELLAEEHRFSDEGLKVVALAYSIGGLGGFVFLGMAGFLDAEREGAREAVSELKAAGVKVVMITGDGLAAAKAIATRLGIYTEGENVISGAELEKATPQHLAGELGRTSVFYRTSPENKLKILEGYKAADVFVAMTGDGVNDSPALKAANVGVAMGERGTEVAKETADLVLLDDNISTIAAAVEEGRGIFNNIRKAVALLLAANMAELAIVTLVSFAGLPTPLLPVHLLWINLVTDIVPILPLALDPPSQHLMRSPPVKASEPILTRGNWLVIALTTVYFTAVSVFLFDAELGLGVQSARGLVFSLVVVAELFMILMFRAFYDRAWQWNRWLIISLVGIFILQLVVTEVAPVASLFQIDSLSLLQWLQILLICLPIIVATAALSFMKRFKKATA